jgi:hypothetical protein
VKLRAKTPEPCISSRRESWVREAKYLKNPSHATLNLGLNPKLLFPGRTKLIPPRSMRILEEYRATLKEMILQVRQETKCSAVNYIQRAIGDHQIRSNGRPIIWLFVPLEPILVARVHMKKQQRLGFFRWRDFAN